MITRKIFSVSVDIEHDADDEPNTQDIQKLLKNKLSTIEGTCTITYKPPLVSNKERIETK
jgi:hypothetical protein